MNGLLKQYNMFNPLFDWLYTPLGVIIGQTVSMPYFGTSDKMVKGQTFLHPWRVKETEKSRTERLLHHEHTFGYCRHWTCTTSSSCTRNAFSISLLLYVRWCKSVSIGATPAWHKMKCRKCVNSTDPRKWSLSKVDYFQSWLVRCACPWCLLWPWHAEIIYTTHSDMNAVFNTVMQSC